MVKYTSWCIIFYDHAKRDQEPNAMDDMMIPVESKLTSIHYQLKRDLKIAAFLSTARLFLLNNISNETDDDLGVDKGAGYRYVHFFRLIGDT